MNIFYLDDCPYIASTYHADTHVVKMAIETAQLLSTAHHILSPEADNSELYKPTHVNHPCSVWVRENSANYQWAWQLLDGLLKEFRLRRGKTHATERLLPLLAVRPDLSEAVEHSLPALAMPDVFKCADPVLSYRRYYRQKYAEGIVAYAWSEERQAPAWLKA